MAKKSSEIVRKRKPGRPRGSRNVVRKELAIPETSVLAPLVRKGAEGVCISCRKPIREHYGHRGVWIGCRAPEVPSTATFLLVPVILPADRPMTTGVRAGGRPRAIAAEMQTVTSQPRTTQSVRSVMAKAQLRTNVRSHVAHVPQQTLLPRYVYAVKDKRRNLVGASQAIQDAYNGLRKARDPVNATQAAKLAKRPTEANRRCLNILTEQGLAVRTNVSE